MAQSDIDPAALGQWRGAQALRFLRRHLLELVFVVFTLAFFVLLQFIDTGNLWGFFLSSSYLAVGRNSYSVYSIPAPPGLFLSVLPSFGVYLTSGYSSQIASFTLKVFQLAALLTLGLVMGLIGPELALDRKSSTRLSRLILLSPVLFFVSFIWVEQDVVGLALACLGVLFVIRGGGRLQRPWEELAGFGMLAFATFTYYFPVFLIPTLVVYSRTAQQAFRRLIYAGVSLGFFFLWFFVFPGWDFASNAVGTTGVANISVYSPIALLSGVPFGPATSLQAQAGPVLVVILALTELALPFMFRRWRISWTVSLAFAIVLPFLFLNILNGDELVWPLPFLLIALIVGAPSNQRGAWLWFVQLYALPMVILCNMFDAPGPGCGSGIFYFGFFQFQNAVNVSTQFPEPLTVARVLQISLFLMLIALLAICLGRAKSRTETSTTGSRYLADVDPRRGEPPPTFRDGSRENRPTRRSRLKVLASQLRWVGVIAVVMIATTLLAAVFPAPVLTATPTNDFPVGLFSSYPVANGSVTYTLPSGSGSVEVAPSYGVWTPVSSFFQQVAFDRNIASEQFSMNLSVGVNSPPGFAYNTSVLGYGSSGLNVVSPFVPPANSTRLTPVEHQNVTVAPALDSPQFTRSLTGAFVYNGSSFAQYDAVPLERPSGQITLFFRWSGVQLAQNDIMTLYRGNVSYQLFGVGDQYMAAMKPTLSGNWSFSSPRIVNSFSWHELILTNSSNGTLLALDGMPISLPSTPISSEMQGAELLVGAVDTSSLEFQNHDFWGVIAGPYNTTGSSVILGAPLWCPVSLASGALGPASCTPYSPSFVSLRSDGGEAFSATTPTTTYWLNSTSPILTFGRLSPVGPSLTFHIHSLSITTTRTLFPLVWLLDGVVGAPVFLVVLSRAGRRRVDLPSYPRTGSLPGREPERRNDDFHPPEG